MIPIAPALTVRPIGEDELPELAALLCGWFERAPYSRALDVDGLRREVLAENPPTIYPVRWQRHRGLGVWRAGQLTGFIDLAVGLDSDNLDLPDYHPVGIIRFLALPLRDDLVEPVAEALFAQAHDFWREAGIGYVRAFHISTGYPSFQAGAGLLPGDWSSQVRALTMDGFRFHNRYYCLARTVGQLLEEVVPHRDLSLVPRGTPEDRIYQVYYRRTDWVASARLVCAAQEACLPWETAYLADLQVDPPWQQHRIGRWLLRRVLNDATVQGYRQIVAHLAHHQSAGMNLLIQHGFEELNWRGYALDKALTA